MEILHSVFGVIGDLTWGWSLVPFLVVLGIFHTLTSGFVQLEFFKRMFRVLTESRPEVAGHNSSRAALMVSVGGGSIAGVAVAVTPGGRGANFWMWAIAAISMLFPVPVGLRVLNDFRGQLKAGVDRPVFDPDKFPDLNLDRTAWAFDKAVTPLFKETATPKPAPAE